jgi:hypothetical protein
MVNGIVPPVHEINTFIVRVSLYSLSAWYGSTRELLPAVMLEALLRRYRVLLSAKATKHPDQILLQFSSVCPGKCWGNTP